MYYPQQYYSQPMQAMPQMQPIPYYPQTMIHTPGGMIPQAQPLYPQGMMQP